MGAYLSSPVRETVSADKSINKLSYGASSMQGWRVSQEDAHNCLPEFDVHTDTSFFAVYDGHGGCEVAQYAALELPGVLRDLPSYRDDVTTALSEAFLAFDERLKEPAVVQSLKDIAGVQSDGEDDDVPGSSTGDKDVKNEAALLYEEATMPLEKLMQRYGKTLPTGSQRDRPGCSKFQSPMIRAKCDSRLGDVVNGSTPSLSNGDLEEADDTVQTTANHTNNNVTAKTEDTGRVGESGNVSGGAAAVADTESSSGGAADTENSSGGAADTENSSVGAADTEKSSAGGADAENSGRGAAGAENSSGGAADTENSSAGAADTKNDTGDVGDRDNGRCTDVSSSSHCDEVACSSGGSASAASNSSSSIATEGTATGSTSKGEGATAEPVSSSGMIDDASSDDDDSSDEELEWHSSEAEDEEEEEDDSADEDEEAMTGVGIHHEDEDGEDGGMMGGNGEPGCDSGCTAVVAVLRGRQLYVANSGDSRAVLCRAGQAVEMSFDHKPEDAPERRRIMKAGGRVTFDGRVNGGLNLSRALGDHCYKKNVDLPPEEQMITALPDVKCITLSDDDEFMVLACDGIWNVMSSQDAVNFVTDRLKEKEVKLSAICEQMFEVCLAPDTTGDGTGCDNMTCIIVRFDKLDHPLKATASDCTTDGCVANTTDCVKVADIAAAAETADTKPAKRSADHAEITTGELMPEHKKARTDAGL